MAQLVPPQQWPVGSRIMTVSTVASDTSDRPERYVGQRFYFDLQSEDEYIRDGIGVVAASESQAIKEASEIVANTVETDHQLETGWTLIVRDEFDNIVGRIPILKKS